MEKLWEMRVDADLNSIPKAPQRNNLSIQTEWKENFTLNKCIYKKQITRHNI